MEYTFWNVNYCNCDCKTASMIATYDSKRVMTSWEIVEYSKSANLSVVRLFNYSWSQKCLIMICPDGCIIFANSSERLSELNNLWTEKVPKLAIEQKFNLVLTNFCECATAIIGRVNISKMVPEEHRAKITKMQLPRQIQKTYLPDCEYYINGMPKDINLLALEKIRIPGSNEIPMSSVLNEAKFYIAHASDLLSFEASKIVAKKVCFGCMFCDPIDGAIHDKIARLLSDIKVQELDINICWKERTSFNQELINISDCHMKKCSIRIDGNIVSIDSLNTIIALNNNRRYLTTKNARAVVDSD